MSRIAILKDCRFYLKFVNLYNDKPIQIAFLVVPHAVMSIASIIPMLVTLICLMRFVIVSGFDLTDASSAFAISMGITQLTLIYISLAVNRDIILETIAQMQNIVDDLYNTFQVSTLTFEYFSRARTGCRISRDAMKLYKNAEAENSNMVRNVRKFVIIGLFACYVPSTLVPISYLVLSFPKPEKWILPFPGGIADEHTFLGYYSSWLVQFLGGLNYMILFGVVLSMEIGFCKFIETCSNDLKQTSLSLNKSDFTNARLSKTILKEAFELHQKVLQIGEHLQTILAGSFFFQMVVCAIFLAVILFSLDQNLKNLTFDVVINMFSLLLEILLNYTSCSYAQMINTRSFAVAEDFYNILWYKLPCNQQKMISMTIQRAQKPFYLQGYKMFTCSMETFLAMIRTSFSYYLILDQIKGTH